MVKLYVFNVFVHLQKFRNKVSIGVFGRQSTNEVTVYKVITSAEMVKRQTLLMCHSKRSDSVRKRSDGRFKMRGEEKKEVFPQKE